MLPALDAHLRDDAVIAVVTAIPAQGMTLLAKHDARAPNLLGLHFLGAPHAPGLVEIVRGPYTQVAALETALAIVKRLGNIGVVAGLSAELIANRMMAQCLRQVMHLQEHGVKAAQVDSVMAGFGWAYGLFHHAERNLNVTPREAAASEIIERIMMALFSEGQAILREGVAAKASDIDVAFLTAFGFPRFRGGPMFYGEQSGYADSATSRFKNDQ